MDSRFFVLILVAGLFTVRSSSAETLRGTSVTGATSAGIGHADPLRGSVPSAAGNPLPVPGACCLPDGGGGVLESGACVGAGGRYLGDGTPLRSQSL